MMPKRSYLVPTNRYTLGKGFKGCIFFKWISSGKAQSHIEHPSASGPLHPLQLFVQVAQSPKQVLHLPSSSQEQPSLVHPWQFSHPGQSSLLQFFEHVVHFSNSHFLQEQPSHFYSQTQSSQFPQSFLHSFPYSIQFLNSSNFFFSFAYFSYSYSYLGPVVCANLYLLKSFFSARVIST